MDRGGSLSPDELRSLKNFCSRPRRLTRKNLARVATAGGAGLGEALQRLCHSGLIKFRYQPVWDEPGEDELHAPGPAPVPAGLERLVLSDDLALSRLWPQDEVRTLPVRAAEAIAAASEAGELRVWLVPGEFRARQVEAALDGAEVLPGGAKADLRKRVCAKLRSGEPGDIVLTPAEARLLPLAPDHAVFILLDAGHPSYHREQPPHLPADQLAPLLNPELTVLLHHPGLPGVPGLLQSRRDDPELPGISLSNPEESPPPRQSPPSEAEQLAGALDRELVDGGFNLVYHNLTGRSRLVVCRECLHYQYCPECETPLRQRAPGETGCPQCHTAEGRLVHCQQCGSGKLARAGVSAAGLARALEELGSREVRLWQAGAEAGFTPDDGPRTVVATSAALSLPLWQLGPPDCLAVSGLEVTLARGGAPITRRLDPVVRLAGSFPGPPEHIAVATRSDRHPALLAWAGDGAEFFGYLADELEALVSFGSGPGSVRFRLMLTGDEKQLNMARAKARQMLKDSPLTPLGDPELDASYRTSRLEFSLRLPAASFDDAAAGTVLQELLAEMRRYDLMVRLAPEFWL